jgi:AcrR family transcriptional regulator
MRRRQARPGTVDAEPARRRSAQPGVCTTVQAGLHERTTPGVHALVAPRPRAASGDAAGPAAPDRKQAILLAAERLFARRGYHAVSIRSIADEAGVPLALVGYHYGPKQALFEAIFARWRGTIDRRLDALGSALAQGGPDLLRHVVEAFVGPVLQQRASAEGEAYALLVARELAYASPEADQVLRQHFDPMAHRFIDALAVALPHATRAELAWAYQFALGALLHHLSDHRVERLSHGSASANDPAAAALLVRFIEGGIRAALPRPAARVAPPRSTAGARRAAPSTNRTAQPTARRRPP